MAEISGESQFFSGNIGNMIPESPLNKMVPLVEDHGGSKGTPVSSRTRTNYSGKGKQKCKQSKKETYLPTYKLITWKILTELWLENEIKNTDNKSQFNIYLLHTNSTYALRTITYIQIRHIIQTFSHVPPM